MRPNHSSGQDGNTHSTTSETYDARHTHTHRHTFLVPPRRVAETLPHPPTPSFLFRFAARHARPALVLPTTDPLQLIHPAASLYLVLRLIYLRSILPQPPPPALGPFSSSDADAQKPCPREPWKGSARGRVNRVWRRPGSLAGWVLLSLRVLIEETRNIEANRLHAPSQYHAGMPYIGPRHHSGTRSGRAFDLKSEGISSSGTDLSPSSPSAMPSGVLSLRGVDLLWACWQ